MDNDEMDYLPISSIQHYAFCPRQFALIYIEQQWIESYLTASGRVMHSRVHDADIVYVRDSVISMRGLALCSDRLRLYGVADVVEYHPAKNGVTIPHFEGKYVPYPVEYKRGRSKACDCDRLQLCAQAMCLEQMHGVSIPLGAIYYGSPRRREPVLIDMDLKTKTLNMSKEMHTMFSKKITPAPIPTSSCKSCSMVDLCQPDAITKKVHSYWEHALKNNDDCDA